MSYPDLRAFLADLGGDLLVVKQAFDPMHEMAAMLRAMPGNGPAVLFENVSGHPGARVVGNLVASRRRVARALDTTEAALATTYLQRTRQGIDRQCLELGHQQIARNRKLLGQLRRDLALAAEGAVDKLQHRVRFDAEQHLRAAQS